MKYIKYHGYKIIHPIGSNEWSVEDPWGNHIKICDTKAQAKAYIDRRC